MRLSTVVLVLSSIIVLLVGSGSIAVITALAAVLIGLESRVALQENSVSGLRYRGWWTLLYSCWVFGYALSVEFGRPFYLVNKTDLAIFGAWNLSHFSIESRCPFASTLNAEIRKEKVIIKALADCEDLTTLNVYSLGILSLFTFFSFWALRQFANDVESRKRVEFAEERIRGGRL